MFTRSDLQLHAYLWALSFDKALTLEVRREIRLELERVRKLLEERIRFLEAGEGEQGKGQYSS